MLPRSWFLVKGTRVLLGKKAADSIILGKSIQDDAAVFCSVWIQGAGNKKRKPQWWRISEGHRNQLKELPMAKDGKKKKKLSKKIK